MKAGDIAYLVESNRYVREVKIIRCSGGLFLVRFTDNGGGIQVRGNRLFASKELAQQSIRRTTVTEKKKIARNPYDYWH